MIPSTRGRFYRTSSVIVFAVSAAFLAGCAASTTKSMTNTKRSKEYFSETEYGVKASPRVTDKRSRLPRGGGRDQLGRPYKVRGVWYYPKEDKSYKKVGGASWYGDAFHGRLTANGEIYDQTHLTAAHPTMPLPSYARVTNMKNGSSVIVRVNDRGPYHSGRIIDLSRRAAEMLDYNHAGIAKVKVEYVGRAPLDGQDERYLMASYRPGNKAPDPSEGLPTGVMIAMNGTTPSGAGGSTAAFPGTLTDAAPQQALAALQEPAAIGLALPDHGPIAPERPYDAAAEPQTQVAFAVMSYADERVKAASQAFARLDGSGPSNDRIVASWKMQSGAAAGEGRHAAYVAVGTFASQGEADRLTKALSAHGRASLETSELDGRAWYTVNLYADGRASLDDLLEAAWANGAPDAMTIRN
ncbi:septal ring lytic transglycosylase RlpA family protein [Mesorhizobium sp. L-8-10]|uniref:septal ring lytic transglycosylase RlpA family protein n=1 Tax=Mesorhizobium sp. L-8-10 TaxID=2744523 RepID=UPI0019288FA2|nr:septal ring lytic transglycosylase RlpA family protein [Mesorhizobium sp. L-8-10]